MGVSNFGGARSTLVRKHATNARFALFQVHVKIQNKKEKAPDGRVESRSDSMPVPIAERNRTHVSVVLPVFAVGGIMRIDQRTPEQMRPVRIERNYLKTAEGSALIEIGNTRVLCAASIEESVPSFLRGSGKGWVTAEYSMLPRATATRTPREVSKGRASGRTMEIQRLIGRSLRTVMDLKALGERSIIVDCDVLQADGGTRTASITGAFVALSIAVNKLLQYGALKTSPIRDQVAATSVGIADGVPLLDLCYEEDSRAEVDMNVVMTGSGRFIELQATAEKTPFDDAQLLTLISLARGGIRDLLALQTPAAT